jgi:hypothetical protein
MLRMQQEAVIRNQTHIKSVCTALGTVHQRRARAAVNDTGTIRRECHDRKKQADVQGCWPARQGEEDAASRRARMQAQWSTITTYDRSDFYQSNWPLLNFQLSFKTQYKLPAPHKGWSHYNTRWNAHSHRKTVTSQLLCMCNVNSSWKLCSFYCSFLTCGMPHNRRGGRMNITVPSSNVSTQENRAPWTPDNIRISYRLCWLQITRVTFVLTCSVSIQ